MVTGIKSTCLSEGLGSPDLFFQGVVVGIVPAHNFGVLVTADGLELYFLRSSASNDAFMEMESGSNVCFKIRTCILGLQAVDVKMQTEKFTSE